MRNRANVPIIDGNITLGPNNFVKGGQTDYNTGTGFFLGYSSGKYKFSIGSSTGNSLTWDGTNLVINGSIAGTATISGTSASTVVSGAAAGTADPRACALLQYLAPQTIAPRLPVARGLGAAGGGVLRNTRCVRIPAARRRHAAHGAHFRRRAVWRPIRAAHPEYGHAGDADRSPRCDAGARRGLRRSWQIGRAHV